MKNFTDLESYTPKKLRTLRNSLNNRLAHFKESGTQSKDLRPSHRLHGLEEDDCKELLEKVQKLLKGSRS